VPIDEPAENPLRRLRDQTPLAVLARHRLGWQASAMDLMGVEPIAWPLE